MNEKVDSVSIPTISIVIPTYGHWDLTHALLFDIFQYNKSVDEILVINNGAKDLQVYNGIGWWNTAMLPQLRLLDLEENIGFLRAARAGVAKAKGDIIMLISNDVRMQDDIVSLVRNIYKSRPKVIMGGVLYTGSTGWNEFKNGKSTKIFPYLEGWLLVFAKSAWDEIGGFDDIYAPNDFEDVDFSTAAIDKGYTLIPLSSDKIRHIGAQTIGYSPEREELTQRNRVKFAEKWNVKMP